MPARPLVTRKAKKKHHCFWCGRSIQRGESYLDYAEMVRGKKVRECCLCADLVSGRRRSTRQAQPPGNGVAD